MAAPVIRTIATAVTGAAESLLSAIPAGGVDLRQSQVIADTAHRPWAPPDGPWLMAQTWRDLLFAHWAVAPEVLRPRLPRSLELDTFDGRAWIGITPFEVTGLRPRGLPPPPVLSRFPELNVRTYVSAGGKPGIFFLSLDAASGLAVRAARRAYRLPYFRAVMRLRRDGEAIRYSSRRTASDGEPARLEAEYRPTGPPQAARTGSLEYFLAERYCLYTTDEAGRLLRAEIHHPPWPLQPASAVLVENTMTRPSGIALPDADPLLHFARLQQVLIWPLGAVDGRVT
jgi:uncharacterized protein YqjF (DUF2071 family)